MILILVRIISIAHTCMLKVKIQLAFPFGVPFSVPCHNRIYGSLKDLFLLIYSATYTLQYCTLWFCWLIFNNFTGVYPAQGKTLPLQDAIT